MSDLTPQPRPTFHHPNAQSLGYSFYFDCSAGSGALDHVTDKIDLMPYYTPTVSVSDGAWDKTTNVTRFSTPRHQTSDASTVFNAIDADNDGIADQGIFTFAQMPYQPTLVSAVYVAQLSSEQYDMDIQEAVRQVDVNQDGTNDFLVSPNRIFDQDIAIDEYTAPIRDAVRAYQQDHAIETNNPIMISVGRPKG